MSISAKSDTDSVLQPTLDEESPNSAIAQPIKAQQSSSEKQLKRPIPDLSAISISNNIKENDSESVLSSETEGPDTQSVVSDSSETGGPDTDPDCNDGDSDEDGIVVHDERWRGMVITKGDSVSFVSDNLNEQIKLASPNQSVSRDSRRSSLTSGSMDSSPINHATLHELETEANQLAKSVNKMLSDVQSSLHEMSAITVGCMQTYKSSVEKTLTEVDTNVKLMYQFMARCEQLNTSMRDLHIVAEQIHEIKRILDLFESDLHMHPG